MADFHSIVRPHVEACLEPGETLAGFCAATQTSLFKGRMVAVAVTDRRLLVLPLTRRSEPDGDPISLPMERLASASGHRGTITTLRLQTTDGDKLKLNMMGGGAPLAGGPEQAEGVAALAAFLTDR